MWRHWFGAASESKYGFRNPPGEILLTLIGKIRFGGIDKPSGVSETLTDRFWWNLLGDALHFYGETDMGDKLAQDFNDRLSNIDLAPDGPSTSPPPFPAGVPGPRTSATPTPKEPLVHGVVLDRRLIVFQIARSAVRLLNRNAPPLVLVLLLPH